MTTFISRQSWKRKRKTSLIDAVEFYLAPAAMTRTCTHTHTHTTKMFLESWALQFIQRLNSAFSFHFSPFLHNGLSFPLGLYEQESCFSLAFVDNMEIISVMVYQANAYEIVSLEESHCWQGWSQSHKISSSTDVRSLGASFQGTIPSDVHLPQGRDGTDGEITLIRIRNLLLPVVHIVLYILDHTSLGRPFKTRWIKKDSY